MWRNSYIDEIKLIEGGGGFYVPPTDTIEVGSELLPEIEKVEDVVRHEVGHGVHEKFASIINPWLSSRFGWQIFEPNPTGIKAWVDLMGGWGDLDDRQVVEISKFLVDALGPGAGWVPGPAPKPPKDHPWWRPNFGPRNAYEKTGKYWYANNINWYVIKEKAYFLNYWYRTLTTVNPDTLKLINTGMPSQYAAMSHYEFFAELNALYYDLDDPQRTNIPSDVIQC